MQLSDFWGLAGVPFLIAIGEFAKAQGVDVKRVPLLVMGLALALNVGLAAVMGNEFPLAILIGILTGLTATGFYSSQKALRGQ